MKPLNRYIIVFGSLLCLLMPKKIVRACGWYVAPGEYRFWILQPDIANLQDLSPFFLASGYTYLDNWQQTPDEPYETNVNEWYEHINRGAAKKDIDEVLYNCQPAEYFRRINAAGEKNSFILILKQPANHELLMYMNLCKRVEDRANDPDPWQERPSNDPKIWNGLRLADSIYSNCKSEFVKLRSAYQMLRLHRYAKMNDAALKTYDSLVAPIESESYIKTAALYEVALLHQWPKRDYMLARVFEKGYRRKYCVAYMRSAMVDSTLQLAQTMAERSALLAMAVLNRKDRCLPEIMRIYNADPAYKELAFLLIREINKTEDWLLTGKLTDFRPAIFSEGSNPSYQGDMQYARGLYHFISTLIQDGKNKEQDLLQLLAAHLSMILRDYDTSHQHLNLLRSKRNLQENIRLQVQVNDLLLHVLTGQYGQEEERQLLKILQTPDSLLPVQSGGLLKDQLMLFVSKKLIEQGEKLKGYLLLSRTRRAYGELDRVGSYKTVYHQLEETANPEDYDALISILTKKHKTAFEKFTSDSSMALPYSYYSFHFPELRWDKNKLLDLKSSWYIAQGQLAEALATLEKIPDSFWLKYPYNEYLNSDPFSVNMHQAHRKERYEAICNKTETVREMIRLKQLAKEKPELAALCYFNLGNAFYNLTWHGKNWLMMKQWWSMHEFDYLDKITPFNDVYFGCKLALEYYTRAVKLAKDKKLASLAAVMASVCRNFYFAYQARASGKEWTGSFDKQLPSMLKERGFDKEFWEEIIEECDTYTKYRKEVRSLLP